MSRFLKRKSLCVSLALIGAACAVPEIASANLVQNGGFESSSYSQSTAFFGMSTPATGWTSLGSFVLYCTAGAGTTCDETSVLGGAALAGPANGTMNGLGPSPDGGAYMGFDSDPSFQGNFYQTISGLTVGKDYTLSFYMAGAQEYYYFDQPTTTSITASLGAESYTTPIINTPTQGFSPWNLYSTTFTATDTSEVLNFLATGGPSGQPPYALLDGVSLVEAGVPEASTWAMILGGFAGMGLWARSRRRVVLRAAA